MLFNRSINYYSAGILGRYANYDSSNSVITVTNCYSLGNIGEYAGGIIGVYGNYSANGSEITVTNCYSLGTISNTFGRGIVGANGTNVTQARNYANGPWNDENAENVGLNNQLINN